MPPKFGKTRLSRIDKRAEYLGVGKEMSENDFPTLRTCLRFGMILREQAMDTNKVELDERDMAKEIYKKVISIYLKANVKFSPPVIMTERLAIQKITRAWDDVSKIVGKKKNGAQIKKRIDPQLDKVFDFVQCQCSIFCVQQIGCTLPKCSHQKLKVCELNCKLDNCSHNQVKVCVKCITCTLASCQHKKNIICACPKEMKLPALDLSFVRAQRMKIGDKGAYQIASEDKKETKQQLKSQARKEQDKKKEENRDKKAAETKHEEMLRKADAEKFMDEVPDEAETSNNNDIEIKYKTVDDKLKLSMQNRSSFPTLAAVSLRYGASDRMTAAIATATLIDAKVITEEESSQVIDHHKVHREKQKLMTQLCSSADQKFKDEQIKCILYDGRKNWTNVQEKDEETGKWYQTKVKLEHIVAVSEPGSEYLFHFVPEEATKENKAAKQVSRKIVDWIIDHGVEDSLDAIGGDSTNSNTGWEGGSFTHIEAMLGKKLTWLVCFLHTNELPLRHLIQDLDGKTNSDHTFSGPLGKALDGVINLGINSKFKPITIGSPLIELDEDIIADLSTDQKYGYRMVNAIRAGTVPVDLANLDIGPVNHSRWLTTANRFLRLYVCKHGFTGKNLSNLKLIVEFIIGVYYPMWFNAKVKHSFIHGPRHVLKQLELVRIQNKKVRAIVSPHVARSAWYSHSEAVLQTLIASDLKEEREFAVEIIIKLREGSDTGDLSIRSRVHGEAFNPEAKKLTELCSWETNVFEPVLTCPLTLKDIKGFIEKPMVVPYRPVHGQSMERAVKEVTRACESVFGEQARDGFIRAGVANRQLMPKVNTKKHLVRMVGGV